MKNSKIVNKQSIGRLLTMTMIMGAIFIMSACSNSSPLNLRGNDAVVKTAVQSDANGFQLLGDDLILNGATGHVEDCAERSESEDLYFDAGGWDVWQIVPNGCRDNRLVIDSISFKLGDGENAPSMTLMKDAEAPFIINNTGYLFKEIDGAYVVTILESGELGGRTIEAHKFSTGTTVTANFQDYCGNGEYLEPKEPYYDGNEEVFGFDFIVRTGDTEAPTTSFIWDEVVPEGVTIEAPSSATTNVDNMGGVKVGILVKFDAEPGTFTGTLEAQQGGEGPKCKVGITIVIPENDKEQNSSD